MAIPNTPNDASNNGVVLLSKGLATTGSTPLWLVQSSEEPQKAALISAATEDHREECIRQTFSNEYSVTKISTLEDLQQALQVNANGNNLPTNGSAKTCDNQSKLCLQSGVACFPPPQQHRYKNRYGQDGQSPGVHQ